jgi:hypothetical protein
MLKNKSHYWKCFIFSCLLFFPLKNVNAQTLSDQIVTDLVTIGITGAATLSGNIPLAMASGVLAKYISTYGIQGVRFLIDKVKAETPQDLGEINIYFIYLIHVKRNLYQAMINMRNNVKNDPTYDILIKEIEEVESNLQTNCSGKCEVSGIDQSLINYEFINIALDAKQSIGIFDYLNSEQVKSTYQYLILLYLDIILVEQKLLEGQYNVLANQIDGLLENLEENPYLSLDEKEYSFQLALNIALKWQKHRDERRVLLLKVLKKPLENIQEENDQLQDQIDQYREQNDELKKMMMGF